MIKIQQKLGKAVGCLEYFTTHQWRFTDDNVHELLTHMSASDRSTFSFDVTQIDWDAYFERYVLGLRAYLCKQNPKTLPSCRKKMTRYVCPPRPHPNDLFSTQNANSLVVFFYSFSDCMLCIKCPKSS